MPTRRHTLTGFAGAVLGLGVVSSAAAFSGSTTVESDFRIIVPPEKGFKLLPGRDDEAYVRTNDDGYVTEIVLDGQDVEGEGISQRAISHFEHIVRIEKEPPGPPFDDIHFEFDVEDEGLGPDDPSPATIEDTLSIIASDAELPGDGTYNYLQETNDADASDNLLEPNQQVPFGIAVDLLEDPSDLPDPDTFTVRLIIRAEPIQGGGQGPP